VSKRILKLDIRYEHDVVLARQRARQVAAVLGFELQDQTRISTAISELVRNVFQYARAGTVEFSLEGTAEAPMLSIRVQDEGPGIKNLETILNGRYVSQTGMGLGILGAKRLMDTFSIQSQVGQGTSVLAGKLIPLRPGRAIDPSRVALELARQNPQSPYEELQQQNQELLRALEELRKRQDELAHLNRELEDTNRGVVALYAELDERADYLQRANELKTAFLSNMTHEFRTPLNAIQSLTNLLLDRTDGELTPEQEKQVRFIARSAEDLSELVNDLLDLAKAEAGKISLRAQEFSIDELFSALRGMLKPLLAYNNAVSLVFEPAEGIPPMYSDDRRVSQVLRNLVSNALKFTPKGEVRITAAYRDDDTVQFTVTDTGIGIAKADLDRIFQEWVQLDNPIQRNVKGTGLGLPLSRRLAELLGGTLIVESEPGVGSTFYFTVPHTLIGVQEEVAEEVELKDAEGRVRVLVLENNPEAQFVYQRFLAKSQFVAIPAKNVSEARQVLKRFDVRAVIMDVLLDSGESWPFLQELRSNPATQDLPVIVLSIQENEQRARALGASDFCLKPVDRTWLLERLGALIPSASVPKVLVIDDDEISRYLVRNAVTGMGVGLIEADGGAEGLKLSEEQQPDLIILDLVMPDMDGAEVLEQLKAASLGGIPVVLHTSKSLSEAETQSFASQVLDIIPKKINRETLAKRISENLLKAGITTATLQARVQ
jgi:signal transduction histidine kinase/DNA-binding response OmpR family regulator